MLVRLTNMMTNTNGPRHTSPRSRTRSTKRAALMYGIGAVVFGLLFVMQLLSGNSWLALVATCVLGAATLWNVAKTIITLRQDDHTPAQ